MFKNSVPLSANTTTVVPFYGNIQTPQNSTVTLGTNSSITFGSLGTWLLSGVVYLDQTSRPAYVSNVLVWHGSGVTDYSYSTLSTVGRNPTFAFSMPIVVTSTTQKYYTNVYSNVLTNILSNSYYVVEQLGAQSYTGFETVLSNNGILLQPSTQVQACGPSTPLKFRNKL
jgi:hypothetical protein